jgi:hypothetical protein
MHAPSIRTRRIVSRSGGPVAVLLAGLLVWQGSNAAFTAETHNNGNNWDAGSLVLTDDDAGGAMFGVSNMVPGSSASKCIRVTANSTVPGLVRTYVSSLTAGGLEDNITMLVEQGTGGTFADCTGFTATASHAAEPLSTIFTDHGNFTNGVLGWAKGSGVETKTYKFTWTFDVGTLTEAEVNALQGTDVGANFEWELQND